MAWTKEDRNFKTLINRRTTSATKAYYEEFGDFTINTSLSEVWSQDIDPDPAQAVTDGVAQLYTLFALAPDLSVAGSQSWYATTDGNPSSPRLKDWISPKYADGNPDNYRVRLFDQSNNEIFPTNACNWFFDYQTGILDLDSLPSGATSFKITGYRYIGTKGGGGGFPTERNVYLVNDAADQTRMGGTANHVYLTWQTAYAVAVLIQTALGGSNKVGIIADELVSATVGDLTLSANYNSNIVIIGRSKTSTLLGNLIASNASGTGYSVTMSAYNCTIGNITSSAIGATGNGGAVSLTGDFICGAITTTVTSASNPTGSGGGVLLNSQGGYCVCGNITTNSMDSGSSGTVTSTNGWLISGTINTSGGGSGRAGNVSLTDSRCTGTITMANNGITTSTLTLLRATTANLTLSGTAASNVGTTITNSSFGTLTYSGNASGTIGSHTIRNSSGVVTYTLGTSCTGTNTITLENFFSTGVYTFNNNSTAGAGFLVTMRNCNGQRITSLGGVGSNGSSLFNITDCGLTRTTTTLTSRAISLMADDLAGSITANIVNTTFAYGYLKALNGSTNISLENPSNLSDFTVDNGDSSTTGFSSAIDVIGMVGVLSLNVGGQSASDQYDVSLKNCANMTFNYTSASKLETLLNYIYNSSLEFNLDGGICNIRTQLVNFLSVDTTGTASLVYEAVKTITVSDTLTFLNEGFFVDFATGGVNLPPPEDVPQKQFFVKKINATTGNVSITPISGLIDGQASITITDQNDYVSFISNGVGYYILSQTSGTAISGLTQYYIPQANATGDNIVNGTWYFPSGGNAIAPVTTGSNIGDTTHRVGTLYMSSVIDFATGSNLQLSENGTVIATANANGFAVGLTPASGIRLSVQGSGSTDATIALEGRNSGTQLLFRFTDGRSIDFGLNGFTDSAGQVRFGYGSTITGASNGTAFGFGATSLALQSTVIGDLARAEDHSTMVGAESGKNGSGFSYNDGYGYRSLFQNSGSFNVGIGTFAFLSNLTGNYGIAVGHQAGYYETASNTLYIHNSLGVSDLATGKTNSLIYGVMNATATLQKLTINAALIGGSAALATNATDGFWHVPSCSGTPTGVPTLYTGTIPLVADSTNNKLYIYSGGAWVALN